jgi:hypothetical protein
VSVCSGLFLIDKAPAATCENGTVTTTARSTRPARDMALSLGVLLALLGLVVGAYRVLQRGEQPVVTDPGPAVAEARRSAGFPVASPEGLDAGWRPLSATYRSGESGNTLRIGYLTPSDGGLQVIQSNADPAALLATELGAGHRAEGSETLSGRPWQRYTARRGQTALVLSDTERTVIVFGTAPLAEVRTLAAATIR